MVEFEDISSFVFELLPNLAESSYGDPQSTYFTKLKKTQILVWQPHFKYARISTIKDKYTEYIINIYSDDRVVGLIIRLKMVKESDFIDFLGY